MPTVTRLRRLFGTAMMALLLGSAAFAQQTGPPRNWDPADTDPNYSLRKQRLANQSPTAAHRPAAVRPAGPVVARPACFEPFDTTAAGGWTQVPRADDNYYGPVSLGWDFSLFGNTYNSVYVNTNGNITFNAGLGTYSSSGFPISTPMVAAFWADVDTRNPASGSVWFKVFPDRLVVVWNKVGYYGTQADKKNTFQLVIKANTAPGFTGNDVLISYDDMQWTTGSASQGSGGFGGVPATVGANSGNGIDYIQTGRFNLDSNQAPNQPTVGEPGGVSWLDAQCLGYQVRGASSGGGSSNIPPAVAGLPAGSTITLNQGETQTITMQFSGPEVSQTVDVSSALRGLCNASITTTGNNTSNPTTVFTVTGSPCNVGTNTVSFIATDNGLPLPAQTTFDLQVIVNPPAANGTWTGAVSTDWATAGNWTNNVLPTSTTDVFIPASAPRMPILGTAGASASLNVVSGATLQIASGGTLSLAGNLTNNGTLSGAGTLVTTGNALQTLGGGNAVQLANVTVGAAGAQLTAPLSVARLLTLNGTLASGGNLTLLSSSTGTAMVVNAGAATVTGTATVQRYLDGGLNSGLGYRHLAAPVANTTLSDLATSAFTPRVNAAYNSAANPGGVTPFPTVFAYDQSRVNASTSGAVADFDQGWVSPASTGEAMVPGRGYTVNLAAGQTVDFVGTLGNGSVAITGLSRGTQTQSGWHLLGNPYPAPLDWTQAFTGATGLDNAVHVYKSSGQYAGTYASYVNGVGVNGGSNIIPLGQAFFVHTSAPGASATLSLSNAARRTTYTDAALQRSAADTRPQLQLSLSGQSASDQVALYFQTGATAGFDAAFDAPKLTAGHNVLLGLDAAGALLAIDGRPALGTTPVTVPVLVRVAQSGTYSLRVDELANLPAGTGVQLRDLLTGTLTPLAPLASYSFAADASLSTPRFELIFNNRVTAASAAALAAQVSVYPNPARQQLFLSLPADQHPADVVLLNALGQEVLRRTLPAGRGAAAQTLQVGQFAPGVYTLRVALPQGSVTKRVVIE
ncbi:T9SS type A sorting domain-containing protein [Hymenobacter sp. 15J16-1T3B]|uniref:nidogen-like domain-containing protein n=1 Tax=Hymenobacter sp. 15J16-1T3B TaxID=2886941 RepID=UPI001D120F42|nr:nidogen-like domain-containing protein [Hymenobacter sp. 15J16-1T3B]MCC3159316.1 T9SS type A sorting domain-containing protein [Hymenobacter sp. 15J16-1T3B]